MAPPPRNATTTTSIYLAKHLMLFPAPLHIKKKSRKPTRLRLGRRKPTRGQTYVSYGPLDDIIDEITGDIWRSSPYDTLGSSTTFTASSAWTVAPLPVSRAPSDQPLAIQKTRKGNSRSAASGSTVSGAMASSLSRASTNGEHGSLDLFADPPYSYSESSFPSLSDPTTTVLHLLDAVNSHAESLCAKYGADQSTAEKKLSKILEDTASPSNAVPRQSRRRFFSLSSSIDKLRLKTTEFAKKDVSTSPRTISAPQAASRVTPLEIAPSVAQSTTTAAVDEWISRYPTRYDGANETPDHQIDDLSHSRTMTGTICAEVVNQLPPPHEPRRDLPSIGARVSTVDASASFLTAAVNIIPEVKVLSVEEEQTFWVAVELEGVQHNGHALSDQGIDVIFLVDNGYYVTEDCLNRALEVVAAALHNLRKGDRVALYTTHCTHEEVTGTVPDMWYPLGSADETAAEMLREFLSDIKNLGRQTWKWPRPNPSMDDVIVSVAKSVEAKEVRPTRAHLMLLSPVSREIHGVSKTYPSLQIHQINPAIVPFNKEKDAEELSCMKQCCSHITTHNFAHYKSATECVRQIIRHNRSAKPFGAINDIHLDIRPMPGCEVLRYEGSTDIPHLSLGQIHSFFAEVRVLRSEAEEMDLNKTDPVREANLTAHNLKQELKVAAVMGASKVHILSVQLMYHNSMFPLTHWIFAETPLLVFKELGRLEPPNDRALDVYKRRFFYTMSRLNDESAAEDIGDLVAMVKPGFAEKAKEIMDNMVTEVDSHKAVLEYEKSSRQNLPSCPGPIPAPREHDFLAEKWEARNRKRMGMVLS